MKSKKIPYVLAGDLIKSGDTIRVKAPGLPLDGAARVVETVAVSTAKIGTPPPQQKQKKA